MQSTLEKQGGLGFQRNRPTKSGFLLIEVYLIVQAHFSENKIIPLNKSPFIEEPLAFQEPTL